MVIATLTEDVAFDMTLTVGKGRGYVTASENIGDQEEQEIGRIAVDSLYSRRSRAFGMPRKMPASVRRPTTIA